MIVRAREWVSSRSQREQRLLLIMLAVALPLLVWLLIVRPVGAAYDAALDRQLEAVDRNGRVRALAAAGSSRPRPTVSASTADIALVIAERAAQSGLVLNSNSAVGPNAVSISIAAAPTIAANQWLTQLERDGYQVEELQMTPTADGTVAVTARLTRGGR